MEQVHTDNKHGYQIKNRPNRIGKHIDGGEPHIANHKPGFIFIQIVRTELERHQMLNGKAENDKTRPNHGKARKSLLALARIHFIGFGTASLAVFHFKFDSKENMDEENRDEPDFYKVDDRLHSREKLRVGIVMRLRRRLI